MRPRPRPRPTHSKTSRPPSSPSQLFVIPGSCRPTLVSAKSTQAHFTVLRTEGAILPVPVLAPARYTIYGDPQLCAPRPISRPALLVLAIPDDDGTARAPRARRPGGE